LLWENKPLGDSQGSGGGDDHHRRGLAAASFGGPRTETRVVSTLAGAILLLGRLGFAGLFGFAARGHIQHHARYLGTARGKLPIPSLAGWPTGVFLLVADVSIVVGIWPDVGCLMIAAFLLPAAVLFHPFWSITDAAARRSQEGSFYRNVSLLGAALSLFALFTAVGHIGFAITGPAISLR
jgi:putative oxidoreductase